MNVLILLLGGNPLPNYVVARYLLIKDREDDAFLPVPEKIIFVTTKLTEKYYDSIIQVLESDLGMDFCPCDEIRLKYDDFEKQRDPAFIREAINEVLERINNANNIELIHLNYTGGTKPMSVNSFITVEEFSEDNGNEFILSDLDPDDFKLKISLVSSQHEVDWFPQEGDLRDFVKLDIEKILKLHHMTLKKDDKDDLFLNGKIIDVKAFGRDMAIEYKKGKDKENFIKLFEELMPERDSEKIVEQFPFLSDLRDACKKDRTDIHKLRDFLNGKWLEYYVLKILKDLKNEGKIIVEPIRKGVVIEYKGRFQEIDLIVMKGFQLFLISCTTSQRITDVKNKLFEAFYRAEQLGGEQAKLIIVSTMFNRYQGTTESKNSNIEELEKELEQFEARKNCYLIGLDELTGENETLSDALQNIIEYGRKR